MCVRIHFSCVQLCATLWAIALQTPLPMEFSRQENCCGLPFPSPGDLPNSGIEPRSPALQMDSLPSKPPVGTIDFSTFPPFVKISIFVWLVFHLGYGQGSCDGVRGSVVLRHGLEVTGQSWQLTRADLSLQGLLCVNLSESREIRRGKQN